MDAYIGSLSYCLGEQSYSLDESAEAGRLISPVQALKDSGFANHRICADNQSAYDLARDCARQLSDLEKVGAIIYSTCLPLNGNCGDATLFDQTRDVKYLMDFPASHLQSEFGMNDAFVLGINQQACTGMLGSIRLARMLLNDDESIDSVLCITADRFPYGAKYEQAYNLISDGAAATIVSRKPGRYKILACHGITNGGLAQASDEEAAGTYFVYCNRVIRETLAKARLDLSDISWIIPQNMNSKAWQILARLLKFDENKAFAGSRAELGHVISADNMINLSLLTQGGGAKSGQYLLLIMAGYGMNWQCVILEACK